ncbi:MAG: hypothetical protein ACRDAM_01745 [Casimicrobium sp.]
MSGVNSPITVSTKASSAAPAPAVATSNAAKSQTLVPGDRCTGDPKFLEKIGMSKRAMVDTTSTHRVGLLVTDINAQGQRGRSTQHETWAQAGYLGRVQRDKDGNIYTYPAPSVTLVYNPVEKANIVYRVESDTGVMAPFVELPKEAAATEQNPFGLLSLTLDCEGNALYASSVYGSTASSEKGVIARIDLATKEVKVLKRGIDALSLLVAFDGRGKRLYVGTARDNLVISYGVKKDGSLADDEAVEIKLDDVKSAQDKRPRVMRVDGRGRMYVRAIPFEYNLAARTTIPTAEMNFAKNEKSGKLEVIDEKVTQIATGLASPPSAPAPANNKPATETKETK